MAQLKEKVIGKVSGKLGDFVGRIRNGKNYLALKPGSYKISNDPASIERRGKFRMACKLSKAITSSTEIKSIWKQFSEGNGSPYNAAVKLNYPFVSATDTSNNVFLTPRLGFPMAVTNLEMNNTGINVTTSPLLNATSFNTEIESKVKMTAVLFLTEPTHPLNEEYMFLSLNSLEQEFVTETDLSFSIPLNGTESNFFDSFTNRKIHFILYTLNDNNEVINFSNTNVG